jgi:hypothetical protein
LVESESGSSLLFAHDLIRKPVPTFRDHALSYFAEFEIERAARIARP